MIQDNMKNNKINTANLILLTDSYKLGHFEMYPEKTERVYSYFESRNGAKYPYTVFTGLQHILLEYLVGVVVTQADIEEASELAEAHFGNSKSLNRAMWEHIVNVWGGKLPVTIKAVPEGTVVPTNNVLMTVVNNGGKITAPLTNVLESLLTHVWYPSSVATLSRTTKEILSKYLDDTSDSKNGLAFMLHDFSFRSNSSNESAGVGGAAHLINFLGTDTLVAMQHARKYYAADLKTLAYSVPASEHSVMSALGKDGEIEVVKNLLNKYPTGILSVVSDTYDIYNFVDNIVGKIFKENILNRDGVFVVRPDSVTPTHPTPESEVVWILTSLWNNFGGNINTKGFKVLNPKLKCLWGDGIDTDGIERILIACENAGFSADNLVFGMGSNLAHSGVKRDTQRFAFKCSAQLQDGIWVDVFKDPKDKSKASKKGQLRLLKSAIDGHLYTAQKSPDENDGMEDMLVTVFENGELKKFYTFDEIRKNAKL